MPDVNILNELMPNLGEDIVNIVDTHAGMPIDSILLNQLESEIMNYLIGEFNKTTVPLDFSVCVRQDKKDPWRICVDFIDVDGNIF